MLGLLTLLIALFSTAALASAQGVCPSIDKAARHYVLEVRDTDFQLPNGKTFKGLGFNGSYVGPAIVATLGEEISIDVRNNASAGTDDGQTRFLSRHAVFPFLA